MHKDSIVIKYLRHGNNSFSLRVGNFLFLKNGPANSDENQALFVHPREKIGRVIRDDYLIDICRSKRVLHFGFLDYPITNSKIVNRGLLHTKIKEVAQSLYGIDVDSASLDLYRKFTGDHENIVEDFLGSGSDISSLAGKFDIILFPEVLEHIANPGIALEKLRQIVLLNPGSRVVVTVPNAYSLNHFSSACAGVEFVHADHYFYFSPVTLEKLLKDVGFKNIDIFLYSFGGLNAGKPGLTEHGVIGVCSS
jgi:hypothetical protein